MPCAMLPCRLLLAYCSPLPPPSLPSPSLPSLPSLPPPPPPPPPPSLSLPNSGHDGLPLGVIIGVAAGGACSVVSIATLVMSRGRKKRIAPM